MLTGTGGYAVPVGLYGAAVHQVVYQALAGVLGHPGTGG